MLLCNPRLTTTEDNSALRLGNPFGCIPRPILAGRAAGAGPAASPCSSPVARLGRLQLHQGYGYAHHPLPFGARPPGCAPLRLAVMPLTQLPAIRECGLKQIRPR